MYIIYIYIYLEFGAFGFPLLASHDLQPLALKAGSFGVREDQFFQKASVGWPEALENDTSLVMNKIE